MRLIRPRFGFRKRADHLREEEGQQRLQSRHLRMADAHIDAHAPLSQIAQGKIRCAGGGIDKGAGPEREGRIKRTAREGPFLRCHRGMGREKAVAFSIEPVGWFLDQCVDPCGKILPACGVQGPIDRADGRFAIGIVQDDHAQGGKELLRQLAPDPVLFGQWNEIAGDELQLGNSESAVVADLGKGVVAVRPPVMGHRGPEKDAVIEGMPISRRLGSVCIKVPKVPQNFAH